MGEYSSQRDDRKALQAETVLKVTNGQQGMQAYTIMHEIGRGASCIVYEGYYLNNAGDRRPVRIKECYPLGLRIQREADGRLLGENETAFSEKKEAFRKGFRINNRLSADRGLTNRTSSTVDIYEKNNTFYIVTAYVEGKELSFDATRSLKSVLTIAKSIAASVAKIHGEGFLYLDLKPSNVFVVRETDELVQLFDFDSPVSMHILQCGDGGTIAKTRGFAPLELLQGDRRRIGPWTDVYSLGALVYVLLFGNTPSVRESDENAVFAFEKSIFHPEEYQDRMKLLLTEFLHRTLAGYYRDRYPGMEEAKAALEQMLPFADEDAVFLHSDTVSVPAGVIGRDWERKVIRSWWKIPSEQILYITGTGGIGKSTLVRKALAELEEQPEQLLFLTAAGTIRRVVTDDTIVAVHGISRLKEESEAEYFERKVSVLKKLGLSGRNLLVLDDFAGKIDADVQALLDLGWKTVIISRENRYESFFRHLPIGPLDLETEQKQLFEQNLSRALKESEAGDFEKIRSLVEGHTLVLELLGRQIRCSFLSLKEAAELVEMQGFSRVSRERIDFARDQHFQYDSIRGIIQALFARDHLTEEERVLLKEVTLFYLTGLDPSENAAAGNIPETGQELVKQGWLQQDGSIFRMHPLIYEVVDAWEWQAAECRRAEEIMTRQAAELEKADRAVSQRLSALNRAEQVLRTASRAAELKDNACCMRLAGIAVGKMPPDREDFILSYGKLLLKNGRIGNPVMNLRQWMGICDMVGCILLRQKREEEAKKVLHTAKKLAGHDPYAKALYYDQAAQYYDGILDGQYDPGYKNPALGKLIDAEKKRLYWIKKADTEDRETKAVRYLSELALLLFRSYPEKKQKLQKLLYELKAMYDGLEQKDADTRYTFAATLGWYYTYVEPDEMRLDRWMERCKVYAERIWLCDMDLIDYFYVPYANMKLECCCEYEQAAALLEIALELCDRHEEVPVYRRKKTEVQGYLEELEELADAQVKYKE